MSSTEMNNSYVLYKGKPLVRCGNTMYYGYLFENIVAKIDIKESKEINGEQTPTSLNITVMNSAPDVPANKRIVNTAKRDSLYKAIDLAEFWVKKELENINKK